MQDTPHAVGRCTIRSSACAAQERYWFCNAPASLHEPEAAAQLLRFAGTYAARRPVALAHAEQARRVRVPTSPEQLRRLESIHSVRSLGKV